MGSINDLKPLSIFLKPPLSVNLDNMEIKFRECREFNLGPLGENQEFYLCAKKPLCILHSLHSTSTHRSMPMPLIRVIGSFFMIFVKNPTFGGNSVFVELLVISIRRLRKRLEVREVAELVDLRLFPVGGRPKIPAKFRILRY